MRTRLLLAAALIAPGGCVFWGMSDSALVAYIEPPYRAAFTRVVAVGEAILYVTADASDPGVVVIDVSDPLAPRHRVTIPTDIGTTFYPGRPAFAARDGRVYLLDPDFRIFAMSDPTGPISTTTGPGGTLYGIATWGSYVYAIAGTSLYTWDVTDPLAPVARGTLNGIDLGVNGGILVATDGWLVATGGTLYLFDISAGDPVPAGSAVAGGSASSVEANGSWLYAGSMVIDVSSGGPVVSHIETPPGEPGMGGTVARSGDRYFAGTFYGVYELDVTEPQTPRPARRVADGWGEGLVAIGGFLYDLDAGLSVTMLR